jgi:hypothetical protein
MKWGAALVPFMLFCACSAKDGVPDESESADQRVERKCEEFISGLCSQYCAVASKGRTGEPITDEICDAALPDSSPTAFRPRAKSSSARRTPSSTPARQRSGPKACELVCNRVPEDPPECLELDGYDPQTIVDGLVAESLPLHGQGGRSCARISPAPNIVE